MGPAEPDSFHILFSDINECESESPCHEHATCTDTDPGFTCECNDGYTGDGFCCEGIASMILSSTLQ